MTYRCKETARSTANMELSDLKVFVTVARSANLSQASVMLHQTPSALSKAIRRLEAQLRTSLFERTNNQMTLNRNGQLLFTRAQQILQLAEQTGSEISGSNGPIHARIAGPAILLWGFGNWFGQALAHRFTGATLTLAARYGEEALSALAIGDADFAVITNKVLSNPGKNWQSHWRADPLGLVRMELCAGAKHPLAGKTALTTRQVLEHDFACPKHSFICGTPYGAMSDGWQNNEFPRRIRYWVDDLTLLLSLVKGGLALAYLPEFARNLDADLHRLDVQAGEFPNICQEQVYLVHSPSMALGWQQQLVVEFLKRKDDAA
jgi:DNA-binding transcriptional LysR family regulator